MTRIQNRRLLILRHGKSSWNSIFGADFDRPLAKRGRRDAPKVGLWLKNQNLSPDIVYSSPAKRAKETAINVCQTMPFEIENIQWVPFIYEATLKSLISLINTCPDSAGTVLLVGHNPGLEKLIAYLSKDPITVPADGKLLTTTCLAHLEIETAWREAEESSARLISITRPAKM